MHKHFRLYILLFVTCFAFCFSANAQVNEPKATNADWSKPYPSFRIAGILYYVGSYDLACYLITTSKGNILINTGLAASDTLIQNNIEKLGFKFSDTKILLTTQAHYDHVGAMAAIKKETGAQIMIDEKDADVLATGANTDYYFGGKGSLFQPVKADRLLHDGDTITLGDMHIIMLHHPGHTKGSCSFLFTVKDDQQSYCVLIANMPTIIAEKRFDDITAYPTIAKDYAYTLQAMKHISFDIWLASHASQFNLQTKHVPGASYNPKAFIDQQGYDDALKDLQQAYDDKLKKDAAK
jgi:metallo-beta-lactamase class B